MIDDKHMTVEEVAEYFRAGKSTVQHWRKIGKGPRSFRVGKRVLYRESDVLAWADLVVQGPRDAA